MKRIFPVLAAFFLVFSAAFGLESQFSGMEDDVVMDVPTDPDLAVEETDADQKKNEVRKKENIFLPDGYRGIHLGMTVEEVKKALRADPQFGYRGDRDISMIPGSDHLLIETDASRYAPYSYMERCWFQFNQDRLYIITINLKKSRMDHYSVFSSLSQKYGIPGLFNPEKSEWKDDRVIMALERPLALKYTDRKVWEEILDQSYVDKSMEEESRLDFLDSL